MKNQEHETLESIIRAAREMSIHRKPASAPLPEQESLVPEPVVPSDTDSNSTSSEPFSDETSGPSSVLSDDETGTPSPVLSDDESDTPPSMLSNGETDTLPPMLSDDEAGTPPSMLSDGETDTLPPMLSDDEAGTPPSMLSDGETGMEDLLSAASAFSDTLQTAGIHFLEFSVAFLSMVKRHYQQGTGDIRANSLAFFALIALDSWASENYTMSDLAEKLQIPKQQLTKLINDLEERQLVERIHDTANRRRVYIRICEPGRALMEDVKQEMLQATLHGLRSYSREELLEMDCCICRLTELMERFNTEPA